MKKGLLVLLILILNIQIAFAHPPSRIDSEYDVSLETLEVYVFHSVGNPKEHYIEKVTVDVNGLEAYSNDFYEQEDDNRIALNYSLSDLKNGDVVVVKATCSRIGSLSKKLVIKGVTAKTAGDAKDL